MNFIRNILKIYKKYYIKKFNNELTRMRNKPSFGDVCYFSCKNNLDGLQRTYKLVSSKNKINVLDLGCGDMPFKEFFSGIAEKFIGVDNDPNSKADIIQDISETLPFKSQSFDLVILSEVLEHLQDPLKVIDNIKLILKKDGVLYMSTPFAFPIHGKPNDFFRYTEYFYKECLKKVGLECQCIYISNSIITTPILSIMQVINLLPIFPRSIKSLVLSILNIFIFTIELCLNPLYRFRSISSFLNSFPVGYAAIFKRTEN